MDFQNTVCQHKGATDRTIEEPTCAIITYGEHNKSLVTKEYDSTLPSGANGGFGPRDMDSIHSLKMLISERGLYCLTRYLLATPSTTKVQMLFSSSIHGSYSDLDFS